jgi:succinyl-diaminopimelate desuccinylase
MMTKVSVNVGTIRGGTKVNMVASDCSMEVDVRLPVGIDRDRALEEARAIVERHSGASIEVKPGFTSPYSDPGHPMVDIIGRHVTELGYPAPISIPSLGGSDCRFWRQRDVPAYVYGVNPSNISAPNESASVEDFLHVVRVHTLAAIDYLTG